MARLVRNKRPSKRPSPDHEHRIPVALRIVLGLVGLVGVGTLLLLLPGVSVNGRLSLIDALFTAASAVTVTGLTTITPSTDLTVGGQLLLLGLIQVGGVGYMFAAALTMRLIGRRITLGDRLALTTSLGLDRPTAITRILRRVFWGILVIEGVGALLLYIHWGMNGITPNGRTALYAIFHAISAFCNAGFDLFTGLPQYPDGIPGDDGSLLIMGGLIVSGGLGIPVLSELFTRNLRRRFSLNTRITLLISAVLILIGWVGLYLPESQGVLRDAPLDQQLVHTWFQSVSTRTAGFPGLKEFQSIAPESQILIMALMFIGSAPASMGGGITTGAFAVLVLALWSYARGLPNAQVSRRTIAAGTVRRAGAVLTVSIGVVVLATWLLLMTNELTMNAALFEVVSAFATCGLSLGITADLNIFGRLLIIVMMCWGRLGALTLVMAIAQRGAATERLVNYPEESVLIG